MSLAFLARDITLFNCSCAAAFASGVTSCDWTTDVEAEGVIIHAPRFATPTIAPIDTSSVSTPPIRFFLSLFGCNFGIKKTPQARVAALTISSPQRKPNHTPSTANRINKTKNPTRYATGTNTHFFTASIFVSYSSNSGG